MSEKCEFPKYFDQGCLRHAYMQKLIKEQAKCFCRVMKDLKGFGMGLNGWVPQLGCMEEYMKKYGCFSMDGKEHDCCSCKNKLECMESVKKSMEKPDELTKMNS
eukprot:gnl/Chilomastix_caulleri/3796.p1 GENE.gnl/Chilomastix_caulleri/3796~~gnl/Chilomastix_caulleri/3796.p1  ORF type:complete len:104 (+),score=28.76 gnl/Chilomastix_caulleri/3796:46-357(+)